MAAATVAVTAYAVVVSAILPGALAGALLLAVVVGTPSHHRLSRRVAVNIAVLVGWVPLLWWVTWPVRINHGAAVLALALGFTAWRAVRDHGVHLHASLGEPLLIAGGAAAALWATQKLMFAGSPRQALMVLLPGADNWAHFDMFATLRAHGTVFGPGDRSPDGSGWGFSTYPKSFHAVVATLSEVTAPRLSTGPDAVLSYAQSVSLLVVLAMMLVVAAVLSLPTLAGRPWVALPALAVTCTALLWEPGQKVLANGFASFWLAAVAVGAALILGLTQRRGTTDLASVVAVTGLLVCVCHTWTPLVLTALPSALLVLLPALARDGVDGRRRRIVLTVTVLVVGAWAGAQALVVLLGAVPVGFVVTVGGGFDDTSPLPTFLLLLSGFVVLLAGGRLVRARCGPPLPGLSASQRALVAVALILTVGALAVLLVSQLRTIGTTSYYFLKYFLGFELILAIIVPALVGLLVAAVLPPERRRGLAVLVSLALAALATQCFGHLSVGRALLFSATDDGTASIAPPFSRVAMADGILSAVCSGAPSTSFRRDYLALGAGNAAELFYPDAWFHAIDASASSAALERMAYLRAYLPDAAKAGPAVDRVVALDPRVRLLVPQAQRLALEGQLAPAGAERLLPLLARCAP